MQSAMIMTMQMRPRKARMMIGRMTMARMVMPWMKRMARMLRSSYKPMSPKENIPAQIPWKAME